MLFDLAFSAVTGFYPPFALHLEKNVPVGAGLGGGSANAAVFLNWLNVQAGEKGLAADELAQVALSLGADVPFFLLGRPAWVEGIGQKIFPADIRLRGRHKNFSIIFFTKWAFAQYCQPYRFYKQGGENEPYRTPYTVYALLDTTDKLSSKCWRLQIFCFEVALRGS